MKDYFSGWGYYDRGDGIFYPVEIEDGKGLDFSSEQIHDMIERMFVEERRWKKCQTSQEDTPSIGSTTTIVGSE